MSTIKEKRAALDAATKARNDYNETTRQLAEAAAARVRTDCEPKATELRDRYVAALRAYNEALETETPPHPWVGRKVVRKRSEWDGWRRRIVEEFGIVEQRKIDTTFAGNLSCWRQPDLGVSFVRALKKDGTPGKVVLDTKVSDGWKLVEEERDDANADA